eukprot:1137974-Pelagomonas_calceolata.AAC.2
MEADVRSNKDCSKRWECLKEDSTVCEKEGGRGKFAQNHCAWRKRAKVYTAFRPPVHDSA